MERFTFCKTRPPYKSPSDPYTFTVGRKLIDVVTNSAQTTPTTMLHPPSPFCACTQVNMMFVTLTYTGGGGVGSRGGLG